MATKDPAIILKATLTDKLHINLRKNPVEIRLEGDALVLEGVVDGIALKKKALFSAMGLSGVTGVVDRLRVRPSKVMTDAEILDHFNAAVIEEPTLSPQTIRAEITDGTVDIEGTVGSLTHKRLAGVLAWWIPGVTDVINSLEVSPAEQDTDDEVTDAVRIVLEKDSLVEPGSIGVSTKNWVVTLTGTVQSEEQGAAAEADAWYVWGVNSVVNNLRTG
jgi:osmotically-inducible protein OsmY